MPPLFTLSIAADDPSRPHAAGLGRAVSFWKRLDYGVGQNEWAATGQVAKRSGRRPQRHGESLRDDAPPEAR